MEDLVTERDKVPVTLDNYVNLMEHVQHDQEVNVFPTKMCHFIKIGNIIPKLGNMFSK